MTAAVADERRALVARLRGLPEDQWRTPSLCRGWTVHHVLAHLCTPFLLSRREVGLQMLRSRGIAAAMDATTQRLAARDPDELLDVLEANAASGFHPPGLPAAAPLTDAVVHGVDVRWALGDERTDTGDPARLRPVLDFLVGRRAVMGFVPPGRLAGLRLVADDADWSHGAGEELRGPGLALAVGVLGRPLALEQLSGPGATTLAARLRD